MALRSTVRPLGPREVSALRLLSEYQRQHKRMPSHAELADLMGAPHGHAGTRMLARLERFGLIERGDRRERRSARITAAGRALLLRATNSR